MVISVCYVIVLFYIFHCGVADTDYCSCTTDGKVLSDKGETVQVQSGCIRHLEYSHQTERVQDQHACYIQNSRELGACRPNPAEVGTRVWLSVRHPGLYWRHCGEVGAPLAPELRALLRNICVGALVAASAALVACGYCGPRRAGRMPASTYQKLREDFEAVEMGATGETTAIIDEFEGQDLVEEAEPPAVLKSKSTTFLRGHVYWLLISLFLSLPAFLYTLGVAPRGTVPSLNHTNPEVSAAAQTQRNVFSLWWDDSNGVPFFIKLCYESLKKNSKGFGLHIITKDNYLDYLSYDSDLNSEAIFNKMVVQQRKDLIYGALLEKYGGITMDMTFIVNNGQIEETWNTFMEKNIDFSTYIFPTDKPWTWKALVIDEFTCVWVFMSKKRGRLIRRYMDYARAGDYSDQYWGYGNYAFTPILQPMYENATVETVYEDEVMKVKRTEFGDIMFRYAQHGPQILAHWKWFVMRMKGAADLWRLVEIYITQFKTIGFKFYHSGQPIRDLTPQELFCRDDLVIHRLIKRSDLGLNVPCKGLGPWLQTYPSVWLSTVLFCLVCLWFALSFKCLKTMRSSSEKKTQVAVFGVFCGFSGVVFIFMKILVPQIRKRMFWSVRQSVI